MFNPRVLEIVIPRQCIGGRGPVANRLFIFTGTFTIPFRYARIDNLARDRVTLDLSDLPGHPIFDGNPFQLLEVPNPANEQERILPAATVQSLATIGWSDSADDALWGVDTSQVTTSLDRLFLSVDTAIAGTGCGLGRISYQVNLLAYRRIRMEALAQVGDRITELFR